MGNNAFPSTHHSPGQEPASGTANEHRRGGRRRGWTGRGQRRAGSHDEMPSGRRARGDTGRAAEEEKGAGGESRQSPICQDEQQPGDRTSTTRLSQHTEHSDGPPGETSAASAPWPQIPPAIDVARRVGLHGHPGAGAWRAMVQVVARKAHRTSPLCGVWSWCASQVEIPLLIHACPCALAVNMLGASAK